MLLPMQMLLKVAEKSFHLNLGASYFPGNRFFSQTHIAMKKPDMVSQSLEKSTFLSRTKQSVTIAMVANTTIAG